MSVSGSQPPSSAGARSSMANRNRRPPPPTTAHVNQPPVDGMGQMQINPPTSSSSSSGAPQMTNPHQFQNFAPPAAQSNIVDPNQYHLNQYSQHQYPQQHPVQAPPAPAPSSSHHPHGSGIVPRGITAVPKQPTMTPYTAPSVTAGTKKIDAKSFPNPALIPYSPTRVSFFPSTFGNPPPATSKYYVDEKGSCSPRFMRSTMSQLPVSSSVLNQAHIPMSIVIQPLATPGAQEAEVPIVDMGPNGPLRCRRCSAYINPFVKFMENGVYYKCPLCSTQNEVPSDYFSPIEANGQRRDIKDRPELLNGSIDFVAPAVFHTRPVEHVSEPIILFLIDVSSSSLSSGLLKAFTNSLKQVLESAFKENQSTQFGFITFDKSVHFWRLNPSLQMILVPHVQHVFQPLPPTSFLANYATQSQIIDQWLAEVTEMFQAGNYGESCLGAAVNAAMLALGKRGGKILVYQAALPTFGPGALKTREDLSMYGKDSEKTLYSPQTKFYSNLAQECAKNMVSVDIYCCPSGYVDLASLSELPAKTGGHLYYVPGFSIEIHEEKLFYELLHILTRRQASEGIGRLRTSEGLTVEKYSGHFLAGDGDIELAGVDSDSTIAVHLKHDGNLSGDACVQFAMVHTDEVGNRLIRVHTLSMHTTDKIATLFRSSDLDAVLNVLLRRTVEEFGNDSIPELRTSLTTRTINILASYRKYCTKNDRTDAHLILPEALKLLPVHLLGAIKTILLSNPYADAVPSIADARLFMSHLIQSASLEFMLPMCYPRIYSLNPLYRQLEVERLRAQNRENGGIDEDETRREILPLPGDEDCYGSYWLPGLVRASASELEAGGVYIMDDGMSIYLAVQQPANPNIMEKLFDENGQLVYNEEDDLNQRLFHFFQAIRFRRPHYQPIFLVDTQNNTPHRRTFLSRLIEDGSDDHMNRDMISSLFRFGYFGYLCHIHRSVQSKV